MATLLMILKIIGVILLVVLGIVLVLLLAVLFVPIRYQIDGAVHDDTVREKFDTGALLENLAGSVRVSWLLHLVNGRIEYPKDPEFTLRILCFKVFRTHLFDKKEDAQEDEIAEKETAERRNSNKEVPESKNSDKEAPESKAMKNDPVDRKTSVNDPAGKAVAQKKKTKSETAETETAEKIIAQKEPNAPEGCGQGDAEEQESLAADRKAYLERTKARQKEDTDSTQTAQNGAGQQEKRTAAGLIDKIQSIKQKLCDKLKSVWKKAQEIGKNISYYARILDSELFAAALEKVSKQTKRILHQLLPRQWTLAGTVGTGDPGTDGKLLEIQGILYPWTAGHLYLQPEFEGCMVYLDLHAKGRITIFVLLQAAASCYFDKKIKRVIKLFKKENVGKKSGKKPQKKAA